MQIGIAFDLKEDFTVPAGREDLLEEYDCIETVHAIRKELERLGHRVVLLRGGKKFLQNVMRHRVDLVFNIAEGRGGRNREAHVPALCEMLEIPITHSDALALSLSLDKSLGIKIAKSVGLPTPFQHVVKSAGEEKDLRPPLPVVLKPIHEGSSMGVENDCLVRTHGDMRKKLRDLLERYRQPVIVEEFLPGKELTVGIVGNDPPEVLGIMEIAPNSGRLDNFLYSIETKRDYKRLVSYHSPPRDLPEETLVETGRIALEVYELFGCHDVARVDLRLDGQGKPRFLEINPLPGISPTYSDLCIMSSLLGISYSTLIERILGAAVKRLGLENVDRKKSRKKRPGRTAASYPNYRRI